MAHATESGEAWQKEVRLMNNCVSIPGPLSQALWRDEQLFTSTRSYLQVQMQGVISCSSAVGPDLAGRRGKFLVGFKQALHPGSQLVSTLISLLAPSTSTSTSLALHFSLHSPPSHRLSSSFCCCWGARLRSRSFHYHNHLFPLLVVV